MRISAARLPVDFEEAQQGFMVGKAAAMAEWSFRKERKEFDRQIAVLRAKKWAKEHPDRRRAIANKYAAKPEVRSRQVKAGKVRRRARACASAKVYACAAPDCRAEFCKCPWIRGPQPTFCSVRCYQRTRHRELVAAGRKPARLYTCAECGGQGHNLRTCPRRPA